MITEDKVIEIFYMADEYSKEFSKVRHKYSLGDGRSDGRRHRNKPNRMNDAEIMVILILFHTGGFRCFKHFYLGYVCRHMRHLFPSKAHALPPHFLRPCAEGRDHHGLVLRLQAAPGHQQSQQHEEHAHERGGQDPAEKEGRHRDLQRRAEEHRSNRALQAPLLLQLHCQHTVAIVAYCFFPKKPAVDAAFVNDGQHVLF